MKLHEQVLTQGTTAEKLPRKSTIRYHGKSRVLQLKYFGLPVFAEYWEFCAEYADCLGCCGKKAAKAALKYLKIIGYFKSPQDWSCF